MEFKVPDAWGATKDQIKVIEVLAEYPGKYISPEDLVKWVYDEELDYDAPAPAKLRVLIQRTRAALERATKLDNLMVTIATKRGKGYRITKKHVRHLINSIEEQK